jgi:hypothetical protein
MSARSPQHLLALLLTAVALLVGAGILLTTVGDLYAAHWSGPAVDFWRFVRFLEVHERGGETLALLLKNHGGHRPFAPRLLYWVDYAWFGGRNAFLVSCSVALQAFTAVLLVRASSRERGNLPRSLWVFAGGVSVALLYSATQLENFARAWNVHWFLTFAASAAALAALDRARQVDAQGGGFAAAGWILVAACAATIATWSMVNGLLVWPLLVALAVAVRMRARWALLLTLAALLVAAGFFHGYTPGPGLSAGEIWHAPHRRLAWVSKCLGAPLSWSHPRAGAVLGGLGLATVVFAALQLVRRGRRAGAAILPVGLMLLCVGTALLAAWGRMAYSQTSWSIPRYQTITLLFWASLLCWVLPRLGSMRAVGRWGGVAFMAVVLAGIGAVLVPAHRREGRVVVVFGEQVRVANLAIITDLGHRPAYEVSLPFSDLHRSGDRVRRRASFLRSQELGMFADGRYRWLGLRVGEDLAIEPENRCDGGVFTLEHLGEPDVVGARAEGWARDARTGSVPASFVVTDAANVVVGLGAPARRWLPWQSRAAARAEGRGWIAYVRLPSVPGGGQVWGVVAPGRVCQVAGWPAP